MGWIPEPHDEDHAARHAEGGADELDAAALGSGAATDGHVLTADGAGGADWEAAAGGASALDDLSDVTITTPTTGQVVKYNGTTWVNDTDDTGSGSLPTGVAKGDLAVFDGTNWVRVAVGTNDQVLTADSAQTAGVKWAAGGGGGGGISPYILEPGMKPPGTPNADDDEFDDANATDPTTTGWSWFNQSTAVADVSYGRLKIRGPGGSANLRGLAKAPPSGDFTVTTRTDGFATTDFRGTILGFIWGTLATPTRITMLRFIASFGVSTGIAVYATTYNGYGTFNSNHGTAIPFVGLTRPYLRLSWDDTNGDMDLETSLNGLDWHTVAGAVAGPGSAPDFMALGIDDQSQFDGLFDFFRVDWTPDFDPTA